MHQQNLMGRQVIKINSYKKDAKCFKALCDENRLIILEMLQKREKCACELLEEMNISQSTLSHHMKILCESGIVKSRKDGKWSHYSIDELGSAKAMDLLKTLTAKDKDYTDSCG